MSSTLLQTTRRPTGRLVIYNEEQVRFSIKLSVARYLYDRTLTPDGESDPFRKEHDAKSTSVDEIPLSESGYAFQIQVNQK